MMVFWGGRKTRAHTGIWIKYKSTWIIDLSILWWQRPGVGNCWLGVIMILKPLWKSLGCTFPDGSVQRGGTVPDLPIDSASLWSRVISMIIWIYRSGRRCDGWGNAKKRSVPNYFPLYCFHCTVCLAVLEGCSCLYMIISSWYLSFLRMQRVYYSPEETYRCCEKHCSSPQPPRLCRAILSTFLDSNWARLVLILSDWEKIHIVYLCYHCITI